VSEEPIADQDLLIRVGEQLAKTASATDHLMLTKWRVLSTCQYLLGGPEQDLEDACRAALEAFAAHGPGAASDMALETAGAVIKRVQGRAETVLPSISKEKRAAVSGHLDSLAAGGVATIERALHALSGVRDRMKATVRAVALPGIRHRFDLVAAILEDLARPLRERARAAAAVLYVDEVRDVVPDTLGVIGMVDDDYALRVVLEEVSGDGREACLHWSEKISSLWDDLPFLQGVNLQRGDSPISVTWLDRVNSYVSYSHVMGSEKATLVLLQPSIACSPLHAIVSLIGLLVLDAVTTSDSKAVSLRIAQAYEVDGCAWVRYEGPSGPPVKGWLRLRTRDGVICRPPEFADRMVPVAARRLSLERDVPRSVRTANADPMQRFFDWDVAIGPASISSCLVLVASRQRALELLEGVQSNDVRLLDHGLVRFIGAVPDHIETHGTLVLVVPSLSTARLLLERGVRLQAILVDGYERLHRGRHELPFLINRQGAPPIISWSATGYYPVAPPTWLPPHKRLEVSSEDLASILELDDASADLGHVSLWEAATGIAVLARVTPAPAAEVAVVGAIDAYLDAVRASEALPEYWRYHLITVARTLRTLIASTPAEWSEIKRLACVWASLVDEKWSSLRSSAVGALASLRDAERGVLNLMADIPDEFNSHAVALATFLSDPAQVEGHWWLVCDRPEQKRAAGAVVRALGLVAVEPVLLRDLPVCSTCVVTGWVSSSFARRLWAHTPRAIIALTDDNDRQRWERAAELQRQPGGQSLLGAVGGLRSPLKIASLPPVAQEFRQVDDETDQGWGTDRPVPCVFLWVTGESEAKVMEQAGRVVVEEGDGVRERVAARLRPDDRVILGLGATRWSPADEFTGAVIDAVKASHPELVQTSKEWRQGLQRLVETQGLSTPQLRARLAAVGVEREEQTLLGWLDMEQASPIAPRGLRTELAALWPLVAPYAEWSLDDVTAGCARLRALRAASGRALLQFWKGRTVELAVDGTWLDELVDRLRHHVQVYEVEAVTLGNVPSAMIGWWIPPALAARFESASVTAVPTTGADGEDDADNRGEAVP